MASIKKRVGVKVTRLAMNDPQKDGKFEFQRTILIGYVTRDKHFG